MNQECGVDGCMRRGRSAKNELMGVTDHVITKGVNREMSADWGRLTSMTYNTDLE